MYEAAFADWFRMVRDNAELRWRSRPHKHWETLRKAMPTHIK